MKPISTFPSGDILRRLADDPRFNSIALGNSGHYELRIHKTGETIRVSGYAMQSLMKRKQISRRKSGDWKITAVGLKALREADERARLSRGLPTNNREYSDYQ